MRKLSVCLFYGLCVFTIVFSLFWMALPKLPLSQSPAGSETDSDLLIDRNIDLLYHIIRIMLTQSGLPYNIPDIFLCLSVQVIKCSGIPVFQTVCHSCQLCTFVLFDHCPTIGTK